MSKPRAINEQTWCKLDADLSQSGAKAMDGHKLQCTLTCQAQEDKVHLHLLMVAPERPAVDKLLAKEVLVPNIKRLKT